MLALALAVGFPLARLLDDDGPWSRVGGVGLMLGFGVSTALLCVLPWSRAALIGSMIVIAVAATGLVWHRRPRRRVEAGVPDASEAVSIPLLALYAIAILALAGYALYATIAPPPEFDYLADWGLKARAFFEIRSIDWQLLGRAIPRDTHPDYPLLLPLLYDVIAVIRGAWSDLYLGLVHVAFALALLLVVHGSAIEETRSRMVAAFLTAALVPLAATPWMGMAEGPFIAFATAALLLLRSGKVTAGSLLLGLAASTKNEGLVLIAAVAIGLVFARRARDIPRLWPAVAIALPWLVVRTMHGFGSDLAGGGVFARIAAHLADPLLFLRALSSASLGKPFFWIALAFGIVLASTALLARERFLLTTLFVQFVCYVGAYLASPYDLVWHVTYSWERLVAHLTPALTFVVLLALLSFQVTSTSTSLETSNDSN